MTLRHDMRAWTALTITLGIAPLALLLATSTRCVAQIAVGTARPLTLDDALARLSRRHPADRVAQAQLALAEARQGEALSQRRNLLIPSAQLSVQTLRTLQNQYTEIAKRAGIVPDPSGAADPIASVFSAANTHVAQFAMSIRPFDGGAAHARVQAADALVAAASSSIELTRSALALQTVQHFHDAQLAQRLVEVADSSVAQAERTVALVRVAFEAGRVAELEYLRAQAALSALRPAALDARRRHGAALAALRPLIGLERDASLELSATLEDDAARRATTLAASSAPTPPTARVAVRLASERLRAAEAGVRDAERRFLPTLDVQFTHQRFAYPARSAQWQGPWFPQTSVAAVLTLPLDLTGRMVSELRVARATAAAEHAAEAEAQLAADLEERDLALALESARLQWLAVTTSGSAASRARVIAETRYEAGRGSWLELQDARNAERSALAERARAARDLLLVDARHVRLATLPITSSPE